MFEDPIVSETRKVRDEYAASFSYDLGRIVRDLQSRQGKDGRRVVDRTTKGILDQSNEPKPSITPVLDESSPSAAG